MYGVCGGGGGGGGVGRQQAARSLERRIARREERAEPRVELGLAARRVELGERGGDRVVGRHRVRRAKIAWTRRNLRRRRARESRVGHGVGRRARDQGATEPTDDGTNEPADNETPEPTEPTEPTTEEAPAATTGAATEVLANAETPSPRPQKAISSAAR